MDRRGRLLHELELYVGADAAEERHRSSMIDLLAGSEDPFSRSAFSPGHFTASCFILDRDGRLLLHHHRRLGRWLQMGGHVEAGEDPGVAALREGAEESGLDDLELVAGTIFDLDVHPIPGGRGEPAHEHFDVRYVARTDAPGSIRLDRGESTELAWMSLDRAAELMASPESLRVIRKIERARAERSFC